MGWYEMFKDALAMAQKADNVELYKQLVDLQKELQEMQEINFELKKENAELREQLEKKRKMVYVPDKNYYVEKIDDAKEDGPFCSRCWEGERRQARLFKWGFNKLKCNVCSNVIDISHDQDDENPFSDYFNYQG